MQWYSDYPAQRGRQIAADVVAVLLILLSILPGVIVGGLIAGLGALGGSLASAGHGLGDSMQDAAARLAAVPLIGAGVAAPFTGAADAGAAMATAGETFQSVVAVVAVLAGLLVSLGPAAIVGTAWLVPRLRFARRATAVRRMADSEHGLTLESLVALELRRSGVRPRAADRGEPR